MYPISSSSFFFYLFPFLSLYLGEKNGEVSFFRQRWSVVQMEGKRTGLIGFPCHQEECKKAVMAWEISLSQ